MLKKNANEESKSCVGIVSYKVVSEREFYILERLDRDTYALIVMDNVPTDMEQKSLEKFMGEHETEGSSEAGTIEEIFKDVDDEIKEYLLKFLDYNEL
ncbi:hypothetical protein lbkm_0426 [Lachnospiraceae bacterium KM106-2]|nr:hypothetical protein lbkm_0426 [Lachnospiraceae bacterium KM106-2]